MKTLVGKAIDQNLWPTRNNHWSNTKERLSTHILSTSQWS